MTTARELLAAALAELQDAVRAQTDANNRVYAARDHLLRLQDAINHGPTEVVLADLRGDDTK